jgi:hypothetical protein
MEFLLLWPIGWVVFGTLARAYWLTLAEAKKPKPPAVLGRTLGEHGEILTLFTLFWPITLGAALVYRFVITPLAWIAERLAKHMIKRRGSAK